MKTQQTLENQKRELGERTQQTLENPGRTQPMERELFAAFIFFKLNFEMSFQNKASGFLFIRIHYIWLLHCFCFVPTINILFMTSIILELAQ